MVPFILIGSAVLGIILIFWAIASSGLLGDPDIEQRIELLTSREGLQKEETHTERPHIRRVDLTRVDSALARQGFAQGLANLLAQADVHMTVGEFALISIAVSAIGFVIGTVALHHLLFGALMAPIFLLLPRWWVSMRRGSRRRAFGSQLGASLGILSNSLRAGYSILQAIDVLAQDASSPTKEEFGRVIIETRYGATVEAALQNMVCRLENDDLDMLVTAIGIQREVGGNLAEIIDIIADTIRDRAELKDKVAALTAQQTMSGAVVSGLPICLGLVLNAINPSYMSALTGTSCGQMIIGMIVVLIISGIVAMRQVGKVEV